MKTCENCTDKCDTAHAALSVQDGGFVAIMPCGVELPAEIGEYAGKAHVEERGEQKVVIMPEKLP